MRFSGGGILALALAMCPAPVTPGHAGSFTVIGFGNPVVVGREDPIISPGTVSAHYVPRLTFSSFPLTFPSFEPHPESLDVFRSTSSFYFPLLSLDLP